MDDTQEMNYRGISTAIADLGFDGYYAHEYSPLKDPIRSLDEMRKIRDVEGQTFRIKFEQPLAALGIRTWNFNCLIDSSWSCCQAMVRRPNPPNCCPRPG